MFSSKYFLIENHHASDAVVNKTRVVKTNRYNSAFVAYLHSLSSVCLLMFSVPYEFTEFSWLADKLQIKYQTCILLVYAETPRIAHCAGLTLQFLLSHYLALTFFFPPRKELQPVFHQTVYHGVFTVLCTVLSSLFVLLIAILY